MFQILIFVLQKSLILWDPQLSLYLRNSSRSILCLSWRNRFWELDRFVRVTEAGAPVHRSIGYDVRVILKNVHTSIENDVGVI